MNTTDMTDAVGSPLGYIKPGTIIRTHDGREVVVLTIGGSGIWTTRDGQLPWEALSRIIAL